MHEVLSSKASFRVFQWKTATRQCWPRLTVALPCSGGGRTRLHHRISMFYFEFGDFFSPPIVRHIFGFESGDLLYVLLYAGWVFLVMVPTDYVECYYIEQIGQLEVQSLK